MSLAHRLVHRVRSTFLQHRAGPPVITPEVLELAERVGALEAENERQGERLSQVEVRVGIRSPERWGKRDAG